jgi:hypothetical protein
MMPAREFVRAILQRVCEAHEIRIEDLRNPSHAQYLVSARRQAAVELRNRGLSLPHIGRILHRADGTPMHHTSILHLVESPGRKTGAAVETVPDHSCNNSAIADFLPDFLDSSNENTRRVLDPRRLILNGNRQLAEDRRS